MCIAASNLCTLSEGCFCVDTWCEQTKTPVPPTEFVQTCIWESAHYSHTWTWAAFKFNVWECVCAENCNLSAYYMYVYWHFIIEQMPNSNLLSFYWTVFVTWLWQSFNISVSGLMELHCAIPSQTAFTLFQLSAPQPVLVHSQFTHQHFFQPQQVAVFSSIASALTNPLYACICIT